MVLLRPGIALALVLALAGCSLAPKLVGTRPRTLERAREDLETCALTADRLSDVSREALDLFDLRTAFEDDPRAALLALHAEVVAEPRRDLLFALAEGYALVARREHDRDASLASAVYAYLYLLGDEEPEGPNPYDRRFRWAAELYDDGLLRALLDDGGRLRLEGGERALPTTRLTLTIDGRGLPTDRPLLRFEPADLLAIHGLRLRLRDSGLGVPLVGYLGQGRDDVPYSEVRHVPVTAFLRLDGGLGEFAHGLRGRIELISGYDAGELEVGGRSIPIETDRSAVLARALDDERVWSFSLSGLFASDNAARDNRLILVQPYERGKIPVVFVHGTASSPAYWAELFNSLWSDPLLRRWTQVWFFRYATGNPIVYSAADLRDALRGTLDALDPEHADTMLRHVVVIGHSQGGLLARLLATRGNRAWFEELTGQSLESTDLSPEERALVERCVVFEPVPEVERLVFVATPHGGSFLSQRWYSRLIARFISFPREVEGFLGSLLRRRGGKERDLSSIGGMAPDSLLVRSLAHTPVAPGVIYHSVIAVGDADPRDPEAVARADDGVVAYTSAHLEGAASEDLVPSGHSCQSHPLTIQALRRILREHVAAVRAAVQGTP